MQKISLTEKLILYFLFIGLFTNVCVSWYAYFSGRKAILSRTFDQLTSIRVVKQNLVEKYFADARTNVSLFAGAEQVRNISCPPINLKSGQNADTSEIRIRLPKESLFVQSFIHHDDIQAINFINDSRYFVRMSKAKNGSGFRFEVKDLEEPENQPLKAFLVNFNNENDISDSAGICSCLFLGTKIQNNSLSGLNMLVTELSMQPVNAIMVENSLSKGWGLSGESYIVDGNFLMRTPSRFVKNSVLNTLVRTSAVEKAHENITGTAIVSDYRGIKVLSSFSKLNIRGLNWSILVEIDESEAMAPVNKLRNEILFLSIFIGLLVFVLAFWFSKHISWPILKLKSAADQLRSGNYNVEVEEKRDDEIGELTRVFNMMARQIRQQARARISGQDDERQRLSRDLHDGLGQWLAATRYRLDSIDCNCPEKTKTNLDEARKMVDEIMQELRKISDNLMPGVLREFGIKLAIRSLTREISAVTNITFQVDLENIPENLPPDFQIFVFRMVQEALNNVVKHSESVTAGVEAALIENSLVFTISDNGKGFDDNNLSINQGNGLRNMRERAQVLGGKMDIQSKPGVGTKIIFVIPLNIPAQ